MTNKIFLKANGLYESMVRRDQNDIELVGFSVAEARGAVFTMLPSFKSYIAIISQTGTDAPNAEIFSNTLGGVPVWTRSVEGIYTCTLAGAFPENKTIYPPFSKGQTNNTVMYFNGTNMYQIGGVDENSFQLYTYSDPEFTPAELSSLGGVTLFIEVRVYP